MLYAMLKNNIVVSVETLSDEQLTPEFLNQYSNVIDVTNENPTPVVGWVFDGLKLNPPPGAPAAQVSKKITKLALRNRLTLAEKMQIQATLAIGPSSQVSLALQAWVSDFNVSTYVDLNRPEIAAGLGFLEQATLIGPGRAQAILTAPITEEEKYKEIP